MFVKHVLWSTVLLAFSALFLTAVAVSQVYISVNKLDVSDFPKAEVIVSVLDKNMEPLDGLNATDFSVYEDMPSKDNRSQITTLNASLFEDSGEGVSIVIAVDASGSIRNNSLADAKKAIIQFMSGLRAQDRVAVISFHDNVMLASFEPDDNGQRRFVGFKDDEPIPTAVLRSTEYLFTNDQEELIKAVNAIQVGGKITVLYQAVMRAAQIAANGPRTAYKGVAVLSDGHNEDPAYNDIDSCISETNEAGIPVFAIGVGWEKSSWLQFMRKIGSETGATYRHVTRSDQLTRAYESLKELLMKQYVLSFEFQRTRGDGEPHELLISVKSAGTEAAQRISFKAPDILGSDQVPDKIPDPDLEKIRAALDGNPDLAGRVNARENAGRIVLDGKVPSSSLKQTALEIAQSAAPRSSIDASEIKVGDDDTNWFLIIVIIVLIIVAIWVMASMFIAPYLKRKREEKKKSAPGGEETGEDETETTNTDDEQGNTEEIPDDTEAGSEKTGESEDADAEQETEKTETEPAEDGTEAGSEEEGEPKDTDAEEEPEKAKTDEPVPQAPVQSEDAAPDGVWGTLTVKGGVFDGQVFDLSGEQTMVSSDPQNDGIVLEDEALGQFEIAINYRPGGARLVDISDVPVVSINGELADNTDIENGDVIQIGSVKLVFKMSQEANDSTTMHGA